MEKELINAFSKLDVNEKRNQISSEIEKLGHLLDEIHKQYEIEKLPSSIYSYDIIKDKNLSNEEYFNLMYEGLIYLRKDILTLINDFIRTKNN